MQDRLCEWTQVYDILYWKHFKKLLFSFGTLANDLQLPCCWLYTIVRLIFTVVCAQWVRNRGIRWLRKWNTMADCLVVVSVAWRNSEAISFYIKQVTLAHQQQPILVVQTNLANHNVGRDPVLRQKEILESKGKTEIKKKGFEDREKFRDEFKSKYRITERSQERNKLYKIWVPWVGKKMTISLTYVSYTNNHYHKPWQKLEQLWDNILMEEQIKKVCLASMCFHAHFP